MDLKYYLGLLNGAQCEVNEVNEIIEGLIDKPKKKHEFSEYLWSVKGYLHEVESWNILYQNFLMNYKNLDSETESLIDEIDSLDHNEISYNLRFLEHELFMYITGIAPLNEAERKAFENRINEQKERMKTGPKPKNKKGFLGLSAMAFLYGTLTEVGAFPKTSKTKAQTVFYELTGYSGDSRKLFKNEAIGTEDREKVKQVLNDALNRLNDPNFSGWKD